MTTTVERPVIGVDDEQARLVVFALLDAAGGEPAVEVSQAVLAQSTGLDRRTLRRVLDRLEAAGWVGVERPAGRAPGRRRASADRPGGARSPG